MIKYLSNEDFNEIINNNDVLVDFYADWCGPCQIMGNILETIDAYILKVNTDEHQELARTYNIMSIPTLIYFSKGENKGRLMGVRSKEEIEELIKK